MHTRHKDELLLRLERAADTGACEIRAAELRLWFERDRLTKTIWSEILDHWNVVDSDDGNGLIVGYEDGVYTFAYSDDLTVGPDSWWKDLAALAQRENS